MSQRAEQAVISPEFARFGAYREGVRDTALKLTGGPGCRCQGLHNRPFLPYLELRDTERSAAAFDRLV
jgi:hypothetical protein